jgi:hypothetical protein
MATRLSGVFIPVSLDTSKSLQQLDTLERKLEKDESQAKATNKAAQNAIANTNVAKKMGGAAGGGSGGGASTQPPSGQSAALKLGQLAAGRTPIGALAGGTARAIGGLLPQAAVGAAKFAGAAALGYGAVSFAAQKAPEIAFALQRIAGLEEKLQGFQLGLESIRRGFSTFESGITTLPKAVGETKDLVETAFRIGGKLPSTATLFRQTHVAAVYESELEKKFNQFKNKEVFAGAGEAFRHHLTRTSDAMLRTFGMKGNN